MSKLKELSIQFIKGVGPARAQVFNRLNIYNLEDLLYFFPRRYEDRRSITPIAQAKLDEWQTLKGKVISHGGRRSWFAKKHLTEVMIDDGTGQIFAVWFNQPYLDYYFKPDKSVVLYGKVDRYKNRIQIVAPEYEILEDEEGKESLSIGRIVPIYPLTRGITQRYLRRTIHNALAKHQDELVDELPVSIRNKTRLYNIKRCIENLHFPASDKDQEEAVKRVAFEEFFFFQISLMLRRLSVVLKKGIAHKITDAFTLEYINSFPFQLTGAQKRVIQEIRLDLQKPNPMLRMLQGDVGSGKTLVAFFGCAASFQNGYQSAFMAPTEILAQQHYENILRMVQSGPFKNMKVALLMSQLTPRERENIYKEISEGKIHLVVGTHALINEELKFNNLSFIVIDEQHKFGVQQRSILSEKGKNLDILIMTATPIPRTLCLTLFGDLDISVIDELPPGRGRIKTKLYAQEQAPEVYNFVKEKVKEGRQAYLVYPLVEESEESNLKAAQKMFKDFKKGEFKDCRLGLVHGQMKKDESQDVMRKFKNKEIDILIATTVIEVGVDVPNANVMVIEHADRFGLSQLHQLRGRIGRDSQQAHCFLIADPTTQDAGKRMEAILKTTDGFKIAEEDLKIRGPGQFFGRQQSGEHELKHANPAGQLAILELARKEALTLTQEDPKLEQPQNRPIKEIIKKRYPNYLAMVEAG